MQNIFYILVLFFFSFSLNGQTNNKSILVNPTVYLSIDNENNNHILFLEKFFATNWKYKEFEDLLLDPMNTLYNIDDIYWEIRDYPYFKPTLLALKNKSENITLAKIAFTYPVDEEFSYLFAIYNFMIRKTQDGLKLSNTFDFKIINWNKIKMKGNTYLTSPLRKFNLQDINKMNSFNIKIASYFKTTPIEFTYYACKNMEEAYSLRGYDYESSMFYNNGVGAFSYPRYKSIFSGNDSEYYPHELVHLYTYQLFPNRHRSMDEALAVYLGGALDKTFEDYMPALKAYILEHKVNLFAYVFQKDQNNITLLKKPIEDLILAFLCYYTEQEYGKEVLFDLMNSGKTNDELLIFLEENIGLNQENFDTMIKQKLNKYF